MSRKQTQHDLESRRHAVLLAASQVFQRYGYARTTMAELATAAQLSRPSLYEVFPSKEELFAAVVQTMSADTLERLRKRAPKLLTLQDRLHFFCTEWGTHGMRLAEKYPDSRDLFDLAVPAVREMYEDFIHFLAEFVSEGQLPLSITPEELSRNLVYSLRGLKEAARNRSHMEELVRLQVDIFLKALSQDASSSVPGVT